MGHQEYKNTKQAEDNVMQSTKHMQVKSPGSKKKGVNKVRCQKHASEGWILVTVPFTDKCLKTAGNRIQAMYQLIRERSSKQTEQIALPICDTTELQASYLIRTEY
jgi:hypothetical protein